VKSSNITFKYYYKSSVSDLYVQIQLNELKIRNSLVGWKFFYHNINPFTSDIYN